MWVVVVDECCAIVLTEEVVEFALGADDAFEGSESEEVCLAYVGDDAVVRQDNVDECLDFSRMIGSHLYDGKLVFLGELEECLWHSDVVVEVALSVEDVVLLLQYGSDEFLGCGLAVGASDADDGGAELAAVVLGKLLECGEYVIYEDEAVIAFFSVFLFVDDGV